MKNEMRVIGALQTEYIGKEIESVYNPVTNFYDIYMDNKFIGAFVVDFFKNDFDNPEVEIKVKAPLKNIQDFINRGQSYGILRGAVERGFSEWAKELQQNS